MHRHGTRATWRAMLATILVAASGCRGGEDAAADRNVPRWQLEETLRIGGADDADQALTRVVGPAIGPQGRVYVGQPMASQIRIFDRSGRFLGTAGRKGDGPGEFDRPMVVLGVHRDTVFAVDFTGKLNFFSPDGAPLRTVMFRANLGDDRPLPTVVTHLLSDGSVVATRAMAPGDPLVTLRLERSGKLIDTLFVGRSPNILGGIGSRGFWIQNPFPSQPILALDSRRDRTAVVERPPAREDERATFRVTVRTVDGDTVYARTYAYGPIPITPAEADSAIARTARSLGRVEPDPRKAEALVRAAVEIPKHYVPVVKALFAEDGKLWIELGGPEGHERTWRAYDESGTPVGQVAVPADADVRRIAEGAIWAVVTDATDVPQVVGYRVVGADGG